MWRARRNRSWLLAGAGLVVGLAIGGALAAGTYLGLTAGDNRALPALEELRLKAVASHGGEAFAIATGPIDEEVEGMFCLDYLTGDLQCFVINPRTGQIGGWFKTNVARDLPVEKGKKPAYLLTTGGMDWTSAGIGGNSRPAASLCWVADANTGIVAAYSFPWTKAVAAAGAAQAQQMTLVFTRKTRTVEFRE
jgi:hypothetical protein